jgi:hypothetical protein
MAEYKTSYLAELKYTIAFIKLKSLWGKELMVFRARKRGEILHFSAATDFQVSGKPIYGVEAAIRANFIDLTLVKILIDTDAFQLLLNN